MVEETGFISVVYNINHYGHEKELAHVRISKQTKDQIAAKLKQGVAKEKILDDIRDSVGDRFHREHLIDKRDMFNIEKAYGLENIQRHQNDQESVMSYIREWEESGDNPILYYKLQGDEDKENRLGKDDFIIILQTEYQKQMLVQFGFKGVCCDTTHNTTGYDFKLTSLLVTDEFEEGIPVAFCLSNHEDYHFMTIYFKYIRINSSFISP